MKTIIINSKKYGRREVLVSDEDYDYISQFNWYIIKGHRTFYARRYIKINGKEGFISMHREILGQSRENKSIIDHADGNGENNQRSNIRICNNKENGQNRRSANGSSSKYLGVCKKIDTNTLANGEKRSYEYWSCAIKINDKQYSKRFKTEIEAAKHYNHLAKLHHGPFANLNIIENDK